MAESCNIGFIGAGKMAESIVRGVVESELLHASRIRTAHRDTARRTAFESLGVQVLEENSQSLHPMAEYHGAARAVGGCAIYVSDKPGNHDFDVLKKLVLPDGSTFEGQTSRKTNEGLLVFRSLPETKKGKLMYVPKRTSLPIELKAQEYEVFNVVPVKELSNGAAFAPVDLVNMFNSGGAIKQVNYESNKAGDVDHRVRGCGPFVICTALSKSAP